LNPEKNLMIQIHRMQGIQHLSPADPDSGNRPDSKHDHADLLPIPVFSFLLCVSRLKKHISESDPA